LKVISFAGEFQGLKTMFETTFQNLVEARRLKYCAPDITVSVLRANVPPILEC